MAASRRQFVKGHRDGARAPGRCPNPQPGRLRYTLARSLESASKFGASGCLDLLGFFEGRKILDQIHEFLGGHGLLQAGGHQGQF